MAPSAPLRVWQGEIPCHKRAIWACGRLVDDVKLEKMGEAEKVDRVEKEQEDVNMGEREQHLKSFTTGREKSLATSVSFGHVVDFWSFSASAYHHCLWCS